jgi:hypothetical protein
MTHATATVALEGTVLPLDVPLLAPLSGLPCVLYQVNLTLWQWLVEGADGPTSETAGVPFVVRERRTGSPVLVDPCAAEVNLNNVCRRKVRVGRDHAVDARVERLYTQLQRRYPARGAVRCKERRLQPGDQVWLTGRLVTQTDVRGAPTGYRSAPSTRVVEAMTLYGL